MQLTTVFLQYHSSQNLGTNSEKWPKQRSRIPRLVKEGKKTTTTTTKNKQDIHVHVDFNRYLLDHKTCYGQRNELDPLRLPLSEPFAAHQPLKYEMKPKLHTVYSTKRQAGRNEIEA